MEHGQVRRESALFQGFVILKARNGNGNRLRFQNGVESLEKQNSRGKSFFQKK